MAAEAANGIRSTWKTGGHPIACTRDCGATDVDRRDRVTFASTSRLGTAAACDGPTAHDGVMAGNRLHWTSRRNVMAISNVTRTSTVLLADSHEMMTPIIVRSLTSLSPLVYLSRLTLFLRSQKNVAGVFR